MIRRGHREKFTPRGQTAFAIFLIGLAVVIYVAS